MDFTLKKYKWLLLCFERAGYQFVTFEEYCDGKVNSDRFVILRHDVDLSSDKELPIELKDNRFPTPTSLIHSVFPEADLYLGDSRKLR